MPRGKLPRPALIFPEMLHPQHVAEGWSPTFVDYFHFSFATAAAFSPTDVSAIKVWAKLMMMAESAISLIVGILVVALARQHLEVTGDLGHRHRAQTGPSGQTSCPP